FPVLACLAGAPTILDADADIIGPAQLLQPLLECRDLEARFRIVRDPSHQHADAPHALALLRARRERPRCRAADERDEVAPLHSIPSSAVICMISGTVRPSALAVLRLITSSNFVGCTTGRSAGFAPLRICPV